VPVNLSGRLLSDHDFAATVLTLAAEAASQVFLEVTETTIMENPEAAAQILEKFRAAGLGISIDDYGSGLSSLAYLQNIPATELKIDQAFIFKIAQSQKDALVVRSTIDLAHSLGLQVTTEGVETEIALSLLAAMRCDTAQGYLIARPMPLPDLIRFLNDRTELSIAPVYPALRVLDGTEGSERGLSVG
jgi:EAL domain-containing protein (putative c-di-GMP-specific phosphodiesterase class I)